MGWRLQNVLAHLRLVVILSLLAGCWILIGVSLVVVITVVVQGLILVEFHPLVRVVGLHLTTAARAYVNDVALQLLRL